MRPRDGHSSGRFRAAARVHGWTYARRAMPVSRYLALWALLAAVLVGSRALAEAPPGLAQAVRAYNRLGPMPSFEYALADLNGDGALDAVVLLTGSDWCGSGGCTLLILRGKAGGFELVSTSTIINEPIRVAREREHGWHALLVSVKGGGIQPGFVLLRFDGRKFPFNPTLQPRASPAQIEASAPLVFRNADAP